MTVSSSNARNDYIGNGVTVAFPVTFRFLRNADLRVLRTVIATNVTTELILDSLGPDGYSVIGAGFPSGGAVTVITAPTTAERISIIRNMPFTQQIDYIANDPFPAESHERGLDERTMENQQLREVTDRAIVIPAGVTGVSTELPGPEPLFLLRWKADLTGLENAEPPAIATLADGAVDDSKVSPVAGIQSSKLSFLQAGLGALLRTIQDDMREQIKVTQFGAIGNNVFDCTTAIQNAVNYAASLPRGGVVRIPSGRYVISSAITVPVNAPVRIVGDGPSSTIIRQTSPTADGLVFLNNSFLAFGAGVRGITVESGAGFESSGYFGAGSTGVGIKITHANDGFSMLDVNVNNFANGIQILACWNTYHQNLNVLFFSGDGILIDRAAPADGGGGNKIMNAKVSNNGYTGVATFSNGVRIRASGGDFVSKIDVTACNRGYVIDPRVGDGVLYGFFHETLADSSLSDGFVFDSTNGVIISFQAYNGWASFNGLNGVRVLGSQCRAIEFWGRIRENKQHGVLLEGGGFFFRGGSIQSNSRTNNNLFDGFHVAANVSDWVLQNATVGNDGSSSSNDQRYGLVVNAGTSDNYQVTGNKFVGNLTFPVFNQGTGVNVFLSGNLPIGSFLNTTTATVLSGASVTSPPAGSTRYMGSAGANVNENNVAWRASRAGVITGARCAVDFAPGVGQSNTYMLRKNNADTAITFTISDAALSGFMNGQVSVAPNDVIALRVITSAGATLANHGYSITME